MVFDQRQTHICSQHSWRYFWANSVRRFCLLQALGSIN